MTVEQVYRPFHEYGYLSETDTVRDYLDLVRKNRFSRFPVVNQHQMVVGVVTMRDAGDKAPQTTLDKVMSRTIFTTNLSTSIATISQRMIAEDYEMIPVVRNNQTLLGVITRRDVMDRISKVQFSAYQPLVSRLAKDSNRERPLPIHSGTKYAGEKWCFGQWGHDRSADEGCSQDDATQWA